MLNQIATFFENISKMLGLSIKIPRPSRAARKVCIVTNGLFGIALIGTGTMLKKPSIIVLGALGIAGAGALCRDGERFYLSGHQKNKTGTGEIKER